MSCCIISDLMTSSANKMRASSGSVVSNLPANTGDTQDSVPGLGVLRKKWQPTAVCLGNLWR